MHIFWMLLAGLAVGTVARLLMPGRPGGIAVTISLGIAGSFLAALVGRTTGWYQGGVDSAGVAASLLGAMLIIFTVRLIVGWRGGGWSAES